MHYLFHYRLRKAFPDRGLKGRLGSKRSTQYRLAAKLAGLTLQELATSLISRHAPPTTAT